MNIQQIKELEDKAKIDSLTGTLKFAKQVGKITVATLFQGDDKIDVTGFAPHDLTAMDGQTVTITNAQRDTYNGYPKVL